MDLWAAAFRVVLVAVIVAIVPAPGSAATQHACPPESTRTRFNALFHQVVGEWDVTIRDFDEHGQSSYESRQTRLFTWVINNRYVEEKAFTSSADGGRTNIGIMLYSFDELASQARLISFWPRSPQRWADLVGCVEETPLRIAGTITSHRPNEPTRVRRVEIVLESPTQMRWRGFERTPTGREYVAEELTYTRIAREG